MRKKSYHLENETLSIVTPPNETYEGTEIPTVITTTAGVFVQFEQSLKTSNSKDKQNQKSRNFA